MRGISPLDAYEARLSRLGYEGGGSRCSSADQTLSREGRVSMMERMVSRCFQLRNHPHNHSLSASNDVCMRVQCIEGQKRPLGCK